MEPIAENLLRLRRAKGMTQLELAEAADLSRAGYRAVETGKSVPRMDTLQAIAEVLQVPLQELVRPVRKLQRVRFRSATRMKMRDQVLADVARWLDDFNDLEELLTDRVESPIQQLRGQLSGEGEARAIAAARVVREVFDLDDEPIRDICGLLEAHGIKLLPISIASTRFFGLSVAEEDGGPAVAVNTWERISVERWIFTAAHELGHLLLHLDAYEVEETAEEEAEEKEANIFASHFLMPAPVFDNEWRDTYGMALWDRVLKVKRMFGVSYKTVLYRLSETEIGSDIWPLFQMQSKRRFGRALLKEDEPEQLASDAFKASLPEARRAGEPERLSPIDFKEDRLPSLVRHAVEASEITLSRGAEILGLRVSEMRELASSWAG